MSRVMLTARQVAPTMPNESGYGPVAVLVFKTSGRSDELRRWVRLPCALATHPALPQQISGGPLHPEVQPLQSVGKSLLQRSPGCDMAKVNPQRHQRLRNLGTDTHQQALTAE